MGLARDLAKGRFRIYISMFFISLLTGCGSGGVEWFPKNTTANSNSTTTTPAALATTVLDSTGNVKATNMSEAEVSRSTLFVTVSIKVDVTNVSASKTVYVEVVGKNDAGLEQFSTGALLNGVVGTAETKTLTTTDLVDLSVFPGITGWSIKKVDAL